MSMQLGERSDFTEALAIHLALRAALKSRQYENNPVVKKTAMRLCKELERERSIYGRQLKMISLMEKGASIAELVRKLRCSRRTAFRYLNYLEDAGIPVTLEDGKYRVGKTAPKLLRG